MPKFNVVVGWRQYATVKFEVEAEDQEEAEAEAMRQAQEEIPFEDFESIDDEWIVTDCDEQTKSEIALADMFVAAVDAQRKRQ